MVDKESNYNMVNQEEAKKLRYAYRFTPTHIQKNAMINRIMKIILLPKP